jgi:hypothetical protein
MLGQRQRQKPRKTLRQALRDLLGRSSTPKNEVYQQTVGSGILRRTPHPTSVLPQFSTVSAFPSFDHFGSDSVVTILPKSDQVHAQYDDPGPHGSRQQRLLPARSLSQFNLSAAYREAAQPTRIVYETVPSVARLGSSRQASLISLATPSIPQLTTLPSVSTLWIRDSHSKLNAKLLHQPLQEVPEAGPRNNAQVNVLKHRSARRTTSISKQTRVPTPETRETRTLARTPLSMVEHFKCFCVLDTAQPGCPVTGTSADLRYNFEIGEEFVLNNRECDGASMDIVSGYDAAGNEIIHLLLFTPLVMPSSGRSRFMLVALIDVTEFISESANQMPDLDTISEEDSLLEEVVTPPAVKQRGPHWSESGYALSTDDFLGGCSLDGDNDDYSLGFGHADDDIWLALAATEGSLKSDRPKSYNSTTSTRTASTRSTTFSHASSTDDILDAFMSSLQQLYSEFFLLGQSPLAQDDYEICNVSPRVFESREYIDGHLSHTPAGVIQSLSDQLSGTSPFTLLVRWGHRGEAKQLYCSPLYAGRSLTWICYLVDTQVPPLWDG